MLQKLQQYDKQLGLKYRNNPRGVLGRRIADLQLKRARRKSSHPQDPDIQETVDNSVYDFGPLYSADQIEAVREELVPPLLEKDAQSSHDAAVYRSLFFDPAGYENVQQLLDHSRVTDTVRSYFGADFKPCFASILRYEHLSQKPSGDSETRDWHLDTPSHPNAIRFHVSLTGGGTMELVNGPQTRQLLREYSYDYLSKHPERIESNADIETFTSQPGSALLFNALNQLHRGTNPAKGETRTILIFSFIPA